MLTAYFRRAFELPPHVATAKAARLAGRLLLQRLQRRRDLHASTYPQGAPSRLAQRLSLTAGDVPASLAAILPDLSRRYIEHRFDLLGSGWVHVRHGLRAAGLEGHSFPEGPGVVADPRGDWLAARVTRANLAMARHLWSLIEGPYAPIDWQIDFRSGFRWDERCHFRDLSFGNRAGADVKVPWELARLQHLPQLAAAHLMAKAGRPSFLEPAIYAREVRNQIVDFLATNPPRFGVSWLCPMDVGIRAANMLISVDILRAGGAPLDGAFEAAVAQAAVAHARHILDNLEWSTAPRSNHYLADIAGVMFCAVYLPASEETDAWLDFAAQQLGAEIIQQFCADGGNFEGSTNYHRLSAEIALFSAAALRGVAGERAHAFASSARRRLRVRPSFGIAPGLPSIGSSQMLFPLPDLAVARLEKAVACVAGWAKPDGRPPQIGDTDSGRLFKLHPPISSSGEQEPYEDLLDHRALLSAGAALFDGPNPDWLPADFWFDGAVAASLAGGRKLPSQAPAPVSGEPLVNDAGALDRLIGRIRVLPSGSRRETVFELPGFSPEHLQRHALVDFGLYVFRGSATFISFRCAGAHGAAHTMGHRHDDDLALELHHDGVDVIADPGSYLYTPLKDVRNRYRDAAAHFAPRPANRTAAEAVSAFEMRFNAAAHCVYFGPSGVAAVLEGADWQAFRAVQIENGRISILDGCEPGPLRAPVPIAVSESYGRIGTRMSFP